MDAHNKCIGFDLIMLRLLDQLNYTPPNLQLYKKDSCEVTFDNYNQMYRLFIDGEDYMSYRIKDHDEAYELYSHYDLAKGHCICTGLGFGVRENWLLTKKEVSKVTVLEKIRKLLIIISTLILNSLMMWKSFISVLMITKVSVTLFYWIIMRMKLVMLN